MLFAKSFKQFGQSLKGEVHDAKVATGEKISNSLDAMERKVMRGVYNTVNTLVDMNNTFNEGRTKYFDEEMDTNETIIDGEFTVKE